MGVSLLMMFQVRSKILSGTVDEAGETNEVDADVLASLEEEYELFSNTDSSSLLKKYLTQEVFDNIKNRTTSSGATLHDCVKSGFANPDSHIGLYAPDAESYACFKELFDPVIDEYHGGFGPDDIHPKVDFGDNGDLGDLNEWGDYVVSTRVRCARSVEGYPFNPLLTKDQYVELEQDIDTALQTLENDLPGRFYSLSDISPEEQEELLEKHILFKQGDRFLEAAGACRFWPDGRGIFLNADNTLVIWVNEEDHLRIISMQEGGNLSEVYSRFVHAVTALGEKLPFSSSEHLGFLSFCPTNLGTGIRASVHIRLPKLGEDIQTLEETADKYNLQVRGTSGEHSEATDYIFDISNRRRLGITEIEALQEMYDGVKEIIQIEKSLEDASGENPPNEDETEQVDTPAIVSLQEEYEKFISTDSSSLLKKYLTQEIFDNIRDRTTSLGATLHDCIKSGFANPDSHIGLYAPDAESYACFKELFDPVIDEYHGGFGPDDTHPEVNFGDPSVLGDLNEWGDYVVSTRVRCARSVEGYPFNPILTNDQYIELEQNIDAALQTLEDDLAGNFRSLSDISPEEQEELLEKHLLFKQGDRFLEAAGACRFWPDGRGIFLNADNSLVIWVNEEDHLRIISMQEGGNLSEVYSRFVRAVTALGDQLPFSSSEHLGFLSFCPTNLGTGIRASVHIRLPKLGEDTQTLEETANKYNLQVRGTSGEHSEATDYVFDISNRRRLGITEIEALQEMYDGVKEIIQLEKSMEDGNDENCKGSIY
ncbi:arginine kinase-like [Palaemon carinicauda]|uniref:arginine kinase-like n=1 Tax=Palaemon carinicauda TaxID=392227 RepID=UPI0035B5BC66